MYETSLRKKTGNIITFTQFEEENVWSETQNLLSKTSDDTESSNESDDNLTLSPLINEEEIDAVLSGNESDAEPIPTELLEGIRDGSKSHPSINSR